VRVILTALFLLLLLSCGCALAQSPNGSIRGIVFDPDAKSIPGAEIIVVNDATGVKYVASTNSNGIYAVENLPPGPYRLQVSKFGFKGIIKPDIILNVQDALSLNFTLPIGASSVTVTVEGGAPLINTQDATVSTVVDQHFVANMPLNGRSFQDLILLTPGVVTNSPQNTAVAGERGEFSVNGQRTESNYYAVDGVSANIGIFPSSIAFPSSSGSLPAPTALGTTQALLSVDALQEFRVQSSTYSAEYGRNPGAQFDLVSRSGTNEWHGTAFDYLRNNYFDANDWFNDYLHEPEPALRQNDFGGTLGAPLTIPGVYRGKDRTFFFFSYEGLRLVQPQAASVSYVPTTALRNSATNTLQPVLRAFPEPNCPPGAPNCTEDLGNGLGDFVGSWSNPSSLNALSIRADHAVSERLKLFFRFSDTSSSAVSRGQDPAQRGSSSTLTRTYTGGVTSLLRPNLSNELRVNYSLNVATFLSEIDNFQGAEAANLLQLQGIDPNSNPNAQVAAFFFLPGYSTYVFQGTVRGKQRQWNLVDSVNWSIGRHTLKLGVDYRRLSPLLIPSTPSIGYDYFSAASIQANSIDFGYSQTSTPASPVYTNFSMFTQDSWRISSRFTLSSGLRWELNPAPTAPAGNKPYTVEGSSLSTLTLAPQGTRLWKTTWYNFAPRLGAAYILRTTPGHETVLRGGAGVFFDTAQQLGSAGYNGSGFSAFQSFGTYGGGAAAFPAPPNLVNPPIINPPIAPYQTIYAFSPHLQLPYTLEWNVAIEQALGNTNSLTLSYVGANGRRLLEENQIHVTPFNANFGYVSFIENGLTSDYNSFQVQFRRRVTNGLQVLASYTLSHGIDYGSRDSELTYVRGNSDFDVRHSASGALTYEIPFRAENRWAAIALRDWGVDTRISARSGFPVTLNGISVTNPATGQLYYTGLNVVPNVPLYVHGPQYPGGRSINPLAFAPPSGCTPNSCPDGAAPGDAPRNSLRGFGAGQVDLAVRREFPIHERLKLLFRAEAFNLFNHPNFGSINSNYCQPGPFCTFGQATATLAQSLGVLSPLYQMGSARSMQFALKLTF
jgi:Carboxypeptidase regulatory-like domain/TonB dependent receptor